MLHGLQELEWVSQYPARSLSVTALLCYLSAAQTVCEFCIKQILAQLKEKIVLCGDVRRKQTPTSAALK